MFIIIFNLNNQNFQFHKKLIKMSKIQFKIAGKYKICSKLGEGAFGILYQGYNMKTNEEVAIKLERLMTELPMLQYESMLLRKL